MRWATWSGIAAAILLIIACFMNWVVVPWLGFTATGMDAGEQYGKPAYAHFVFTFFFLLFTIVPRIWAKRINLVVAALNLAWAIRNFFLISACSGGLCPEKQAGIYLILIASVLMLVAALLPDFKIKSNT